MVEISQVAFAMPMPGSQELCVTAILSDLLLFFCLAAFYSGIGFAIASLLN
jgi:hypothetical protein